ncbi:hypothetical protein NDU88_004935 [Pleurodeles waltl]|uniref:Uncharacterized protein n=1 Tax=Pleurodeles waltl TaxID=8319 RepID=A0AAV7TTD4_PLEWA|nr:hypothetical protein NDU88_004935 [Pleurodeles waltl]
MDGVQTTPLRQVTRGEGRHRRGENPAAPLFQGRILRSGHNPCASDEAQVPVVRHPGPKRARAAARGLGGSCDACWFQGRYRPRPARRPLRS